MIPLWPKKQWEYVMTYNQLVIGVIILVIFFGGGHNCSILIMKTIMILIINIKTLRIKAKRVPQMIGKLASDWGNDWFYGACKK